MGKTVPIFFHLFFIVFAISLLTNSLSALYELGRQKMLNEPNLKLVPLSLAAAHCEVCGEGFSDYRPCVICQKCQAPHHKDCWAEAGDKCSTFACGEKNYAAQAHS